jgi:hypothetical protein
METYFFISLSVRFLLPHLLCWVVICSSQGSSGGAGMCPPNTGEGASVSARTVVKKMAMPQSHPHHDQTITSWKLMETATRGYKVVIFLTLQAMSMQDVCHSTTYFFMVVITAFVFQHYYI